MTELVIALSHSGFITVQFNPYLVIKHLIIRCVLCFNALVELRPSLILTLTLTLTLMGTYVWSSEPDTYPESDVPFLFRFTEDTFLKKLTSNLNLNLIQS